MTLLLAATDLLDEPACRFLRWRLRLLAEAFSASHLFVIANVAESTSLTGFANAAYIPQGFYAALDKM